MSEINAAEGLLIRHIRAGEAAAWQEFIETYEGRLLAFAESRMGRKAAAEDVVQETFIGFLTSLPNFDGRRSLESYLFTICAYKLTDHLRREGRRPTVPLAAFEENELELAGTSRGASGLARSRERRQLEEASLEVVLREQVARWKERGDFWKIGCVELLFVRGWANREVSTRMHLSEQQVANLKFDFLAKLRAAMGRQGLSEDVFPELAAD